MSLDRRERGHSGDERRVSFSLPRGEKATRRANLERERAGTESSQNEPPLFVKSVLESEGEIRFKTPAKHKKKWKIRLPWGKTKRQKALYQYDFDETCPDCLEGLYEARRARSSSESDLEQQSKNENEQTFPTQPVSSNSASDIRSIDVDGETKSECHSTINVEVMENLSDSQLPTSRKPQNRPKRFQMLGRKNQDACKPFLYDSSFEVDDIWGSKHQLETFKNEKYSSKGYRQSIVSPAVQRKDNETESLESRHQKLGKHFSDSTFVENLNCIDLGVPNTHSSMKKSNSLPSFLRKKKKKKAVAELKKRPGSVNETPKREARNERAVASDSVNSFPKVDRFVQSRTGSIPSGFPFATGEQPSIKPDCKNTHKRPDCSPTQMSIGVDSLSNERKLERAKPKFSTEFRAIDNPSKDSLKFIDYFNFKKMSPTNMSSDKRAISDEILTKESRLTSTTSLASFDLRIKRRSYEEMLNLLEDEMFNTLTDESNDSFECVTDTASNGTLVSNSIQEAALSKRSSSSGEIEIIHKPFLKNLKKGPDNHMSEVIQHPITPLPKPSEEPTTEPVWKILPSKEEMKLELPSEVSTETQPNTTKMRNKEKHKKKRKKAKAKIDFSSSSNSSLDDRSDHISRYRLPPLKKTFGMNKGLKAHSHTKKEERSESTLSSSQEDLPPDFPPPPVPENDPTKGEAQTQDNLPEKAASPSSHICVDPTNLTQLKEESRSKNYNLHFSPRKEIDDSPYLLNPFARTKNTEGENSDSFNSVETHQNLSLGGLPKILGRNSDTRDFEMTVLEPDDVSNDDSNVFLQKEMIDLNHFYGRRNARITDLVGEVNSLLKPSPLATRLKDFSRKQSDSGTSLTTKSERDIDVSEISCPISSKQMTEIKDSHVRDYPLKAKSEEKQFADKGLQTPPQMDYPLLNLLPRPYTEFSKSFNPIRLKSYPEILSKDPRELNDSSLNQYDSGENRQSEDSDMKMEPPVDFHQYNVGFLHLKGEDPQFSSEKTLRSSSQIPGTMADSASGYIFSPHTEGNNERTQREFDPKDGYKNLHLETSAVSSNPTHLPNSLSDTHNSANVVAKDLLTKKDTSKGRSLDIKERNFSYLLTKPVKSSPSPSRMLLPPPPPPPRPPPKENQSSFAPNEPANQIGGREGFSSDKKSSLAKDPQRIGTYYASSRYCQEDPAGRYVVKMDAVDDDMFGSRIGIPLHFESDSSQFAFERTMTPYEEYSRFRDHTQRTETAVIPTSHNPLPLPPRDYGLKEQKRNIVTFNLPRNSVSSPVTVTYGDSSMRRTEVSSELLARTSESEPSKKMQPGEHQGLPISREQLPSPGQIPGAIDESSMVTIEHNNSKLLIKPDNRKNNAPFENASWSRSIDSSKNLSTAVPNRPTKRPPPLKGILRNTNRPIGSIRSQDELNVGSPRPLFVSNTVNRSVFNSVVERVEISDTSDSSESPALPNQPPPPAHSIPQHQMEFLDNLLQSSPNSLGINQVRPNSSYYVPTIVEGSGIRPELETVYQNVIHASQV